MYKSAQNKVRQSAGKSATCCMKGDDVIIKWVELVVWFCVSESALKFDDKSYLKYLHRMDEDDQGFKLSLRFKTFQEQGLIMSTSGTKDWGTLQVHLSGLD